MHDAERRRQAFVAQLDAQSALEWVRDNALPNLLLSESALRSPKGNVTILDCTPEYARALGHLLNADADVSSALEPVLPLVNHAVYDEDGLAVIRRAPLQGSEHFAAAFCRGLGAQGIGLTRTTAQSLSNEAAYPGAPIDAICLAVARSAVRATTLTLTRVDAVLERLSAASRTTLQSEVACELRDGRIKQAPVISQDEKCRTTLQFSPQLKENIEWAHTTSQVLSDAMAELDAIVADKSLGFKFDLRTNDVFLFDARRWLFAVDFEDIPGMDARFVRGLWMPAAALPPDEQRTAPTNSLVIQGLILHHHPGS